VTFTTSAALLFVGNATLVFFTLTSPLTTHILVATVTVSLLVVTTMVMAVSALALTSLIAELAEQTMVRRVNASVFDTVIGDAVGVLRAAGSDMLLGVATCTMTIA
jgi:hypothetical protein